MSRSAKNRRSVYLPQNLVMRVREHAEQLRRENPSMAINFSSALRDATLRGLDAVQSQERAQ